MVKVALAVLGVYLIFCALLALVLARAAAQAERASEETWQSSRNVLDSIPRQDRNAYHAARSRMTMALLVVDAAHGTRYAESMMSYLELSLAVDSYIAAAREFSRVVAEELDERRSRVREDDQG